MEILESWTLHLKEDSISFPTRKKWAWANEEWEEEWIQSRLQALANQHFKPTPPKGTNFVKACALMEILESWTLHLKEDSISFPTRKKWAWANEEWEQEWIQSRLQALANQHFKPTPPKGTNFVKACALMEILWIMNPPPQRRLHKLSNEKEMGLSEWGVRARMDPKSAPSTC